MTDDKNLWQQADQLAGGDTPEVAILSSAEAQKISDALQKIADIRDAFQCQQESAYQALGEQWLHLKIIKKLGEGGIGLVYQAYDRLLDRFVALKVLRPDSLALINDEYFIEEAKRMAQVRHPHIMAVYGADKRDGISAFWGELLSGQNLSDYLQEQPELSVEKKLQLASQLADAVKAIHQHDLIHGDIKNLNVMIEPSRGAVLMDFGAAVDQKLSGHLKLHPLTPLAMAPEQFNGHGRSQPADVFALGVVFYYLFNGYYPFAGSNYDELKHHVLSHQVQSSQCKGRLGHKITDLYLAMLNHDADQRPSIQQVNQIVAELIRWPLVQAKKKIYVMFVLLLMAVALFSTFHAYKTAQINTQLITANKETETVNTLLTQIIRSPSHIEQGEHVLLKDVVLQKANEINRDRALSAAVRNRINLAFAHSLGSLGEFDKQAQLLQDIIAAPGSSHQSTISALIQLAELKLSQNNLPQNNLSGAKQLLMSAKQQAPAILQQDTHLQIALHDAYAQLYLQQQDYKTALKHSRQSVQLWETVANNFDASATWLKQGQIYLALSDFKAAEKSFSRCAEVAELFRGAENWNAIACQIQLARVFTDLGEYDRAENTYEKVLPVAGHFLGADSLELFKVRINYASVLSNTRQTDKALQVGEKNRKEAIQYNLPDTYRLFIENNLASDYINSGLYQKAERLYEQLIPDLKDYYSSTHETVFQAYSNLAELYHKTGRPEKAIELLEVQIPKAQQSIGASHLATLEMQGSMAWSYHLMARDDLALPLIQAVLQSKSQVFGINHPITQQAQQRLAAITEPL